MAYTEVLKVKHENASRGQQNMDIHRSAESEAWKCVLRSAKNTSNSKHMHYLFCATAATFEGKKKSANKEQLT